ncbi:MAG: SDR family NAD(P)-dependent oxidoreductase [Pseudomonadota bacterium]
MAHQAIAPGKIAVVTGAALGIGRALARRFVREGMKVALLDVDAEHLNEARTEVGGETDGILCDVAEIEALEHARDRIQDAFGGTPSVLVNNAVTRVGRGLEAPLEEWRRALDINVMGVVNGVRAFLPAMRASGEPGLVINTGSKQGITNPPGHPVYNMAKAAVKTYTECLQHDLRQDSDCRISAHLLVPGWTTTGLNEPKPGAWMPDQVVDYMFDAIGRSDFYIICPDGEVTEKMDRSRIAWAAADIAENRPPLSRWHPDWQDAYARTERR